MRTYIIFFQNVKLFEVQAPSMIEALDMVGVKNNVEYCAVNKDFYIALNGE
jgi:hypothetical protein